MLCGQLHRMLLAVLLLACVAGLGCLGRGIIEGRSDRDANFPISHTPLPKSQAPRDQDSLQELTRQIPSTDEVGAVLYGIIGDVDARAKMVGDTGGPTLPQQHLRPPRPRATTEQDLDSAASSDLMQRTHSGNTGLRNLQQLNEITVVVTAGELREALDTGAQHIEIQEHLDLTELELDIGDRILGTIPESVRSIRGNCNNEAEFGPIPDKHAIIRDFKLQQCLIVSDHNVLEVWDSKLWLESLYFRLGNPRSGTFDHFVLVNGPIAELWMTHVTMQGNGDDVQDCIDCGVAVRNQGSVYMGDCLVADFDGFRMAYVGEGGKLALTDSTFDTNILFSDNYGAAVVEADGAGGSGVRLQGCTFSGKPPGDTLPRLLADNRGTADVATFYSDADDPLVCTFTGDEQSAAPPDCINSAPASLEDSSSVIFLSGSSAWLIQTQQDIESLAGGALVNPSPVANPATLESGETGEYHASGVEPSTTQAATAADSTDFLSWEYVWVAVLVLAILAGIGITAICLF